MHRKKSSEEDFLEVNVDCNSRTFSDLFTDKAITITITYILYSTTHGCDGISNSTVNCDVVCVTPFNVLTRVTVTWDSDFRNWCAEAYADFI